jgi:hypothetical protein
LVLVINTDFLDDASTLMKAYLDGRGGLCVTVYSKPRAKSAGQVLNELPDIGNLAIQAGGNIVSLTAS